METKFWGHIEHLEVHEQTYQVRIELNEKIHFTIDKPDLALLVSMLKGKLKYGKVSEHSNAVYQRPKDDNKYYKHIKALESGNPKAVYTSWCLVDIE